MLLGDGAIGTMLQSFGLEVGRAPEPWNLEWPDRVAEVHRQYGAAGAAWVTTNSFGANRARLASAGREHELEQINREAVRLAREGSSARVVASVGPTGIRDSAECDRIYEEQVGVLAGAGAETFLVETIVSLAEGVSAVRAAARFGAVWATFTPSDAGLLLDGSDPEVAAELLVRAGASVVGVNCGSGPASLLLVARRLVRADLAPVLAAPNAGLPRWADGRPLYDLSPDGFARAAIQFQEFGVRYFAGCCGTSPEHIAAAHRALHALRPESQAG
jgi:methionine synthase I (cobalamin-dependent)